MDALENDFDTIALLLRPQGRRGELLADTETSDMTRLAAGATAFLVPTTATAPAADGARIAIESQWAPTGRNAGRIVLKLAGIDSIDAAERLSGFRLMLPRAERPPLDPDSFYVSDLIGCTLFNGDTVAGEVVDVEFATGPDGKTRLAEAAPLLCVLPTGAPADAEPTLVPFVRAQLRSVDTANRRIVMDLPEGLFDSPEA